MKTAAFRLVPFEAGHLAALEVRAYEAGFLARMGNLAAYGALLARDGMALTAIDAGGAPLACFGVIPVRLGVAEAWVALSRSFPVARPNRLWVRMTRAARVGLARLLRRRYHRVQVAVPARFAEGCAWVRRLGFIEEGTMTRYGADGEDFVLFAKVRR